MSVPGFRELRVLTLMRGLEQARQAITEVEDLDAEVGERLRVRYERLTLDAQVKLGESDENLTKAEDLIGETLEFLAGAAARKIDYDQGLSKLALAWLDQLSDTADVPRVGLVIPASDEFTGMLTQVVRLRVPSEGLWALPVAVHEYGHFVAAELHGRVVRDGLPDAIHPVEDVLQDAARKAQLPQLYRHGHELFADALAAATVGAAYPWYCIRYRFPAKTAQKVTGTHPAPVRRIRMQLAVLDRLTPADASGYFAGDVEDIRKVWQAGLDADGTAGDVPADPVLDQLEAELIRTVFEESHLKGIRYDDHSAARALAVNPEGARTSVAHVLNAAWTRRRQLEKTANPSEAAIIDGLDAIDSWARTSVAQVLG